MLNTLEYIDLATQVALRVEFLPAPLDEQKRAKARTYPAGDRDGLVVSEAGRQRRDALFEDRHLLVPGIERALSYGLHHAWVATLYVPLIIGHAGRRPERYRRQSAFPVVVVAGRTPATSSTSPERWVHWPAGTSQRHPRPRPPSRLHCHFLAPSLSVPFTSQYDDTTMSVGTTAEVSDAPWCAPCTGSPP
jgi:hypothetical protein